MMTEDVLNVLLDKPQEFEVGRVSVSLYQPSLGVSLLMQGAVKKLGINVGALQINPFLEVLRVVRSKRGACALVVALCTLKGRDACDSKRLSQRVRTIGSLSDSDLATLLVVVLNRPTADTISEKLGIAQENRRMSDATSAKREKSTVASFGGVSVYGSLLDAACSRYGWTYDYALWGVSLANLQLMIADSVKTAIVGDTDLERAQRIDGNSPQSKDLIHSMSWD